mgnify:CR=1 FL=1
MTRLLPLVLAAALGGCGATGNEIASCIYACSGHGGVRILQAGARESECFCLEDRVMAIVRDSDKLSLALSCDWQRAPEGGAGR